MFVQQGMMRLKGMSVVRDACSVFGFGFRLGHRLGKRQMSDFKRSLDAIGTYQSCCLDPSINPYTNFPIF